MQILFQRAVQIGLALAFSGWLTPSLAQSAAPAPAPAAETDTSVVKPPPRDIKDILRVLEASKIDLSEVERARQLIAAPLPAETAGNMALNAFFHKRAIAYQKLGKTQEAVLDFRRVAINHPHDNPQFQMRDFLELGVIEGNAGNIAKALEALEKVKSMAERQRMGGMVLTANRLLSAYHGIAGNFERAGALLRDADAQMVLLRRSPRLTEFATNWESQLESTRGTFYRQQGQWVESERSTRKAIRLLQQMLDKAKNNPKKIDDLSNAERSLADGNNNARGTISQLIYRQMELANVLLEQRKMVDAEYYAREGLTLALDTFGRNSTEVGKTLTQLSKVISELGRSGEALVLAKAALAANVEGGISDDSYVMAISRKFYATALVADGQYLEADKVFREMMAGVRKDPELEKTFRPNDLDWVLAMQKIGRSAEAGVMSAAMLKSAEDRLAKGSPRVALIRAFNAVSLQNQGKLKEAQLAYQAAIPVLVDQTKNDAENDTATLKQQQRSTYLFENYLAMLAQLARAEPAQAQAAAVEAFRIADLAKSSGVQRALTASAARANIRDPKLAELARKEQDLQRRVTSLSELLTGLLAAPPEQQLPTVQAKIRQDIVGFISERENLKKEIERKFPDYADMVDPKPATVERTRQLLRADEVLVSWYFGEKEAYVWAISKTGVPLFKSLTLGRGEMAKQVTLLRKALDPGVSTVDEIPPFNTQAAYQLYEQILAPVQDSLKGKKVLLVVPHAELGQLPLAVLLTRDTPMPAATAVPFAGYRAMPWLIRDIALAQLPSVTALAALRNAPAASPGRKNFIGFGDPFFSSEQAQSAEKRQPSADPTQLATRGLPLLLRSVPKTSGVSSAELALLPRLPDTQAEILEIAKVLAAEPGDVYLNKQASVKSVLETDLSNRKVVMFATHGLVPGELDGLTQPALALSSPDVTGEKGGDGLLTMDKVLTLKLNADWVVLSACNTASGEGSGSEAVSGLGRAFFYAGARALLVSNWPVDSVAARLLMTDLFKRQQGGSEAQNKAESLRQAMLAQLDQGGMPSPKEMQYSYAHPLFWAPFVVVGD